MSWWICIDCPSEHRNWVYIGDPDDLTRPDVSHIDCWVCKTRFPAVDGEDEEGWVEQGQPESR